MSYREKTGPNDNKIFGHTAERTRKINLGGRTSRGGRRL